MNSDIDYDALLNTVSDPTTMRDMNQEKITELNSLGVMFNDGTMNLTIATPEEQKTSEALDNIVKQPTVTINTDTDKPNMILSKTELVRALRYAQIMIKKVSNDIESSSLNITLKDDKVLYRLKDNMTYVTLTGSVKVSNNNPLTKSLSFNTTYLMKVLQAGAAEDILLYEDEVEDSKHDMIKVVKARLINGDLVVDYQNADDAKLQEPGVKSELMSRVSSQSVVTLCNTMIPLISETQDISSKRSIIYDDRAIFRSSTYMLEVKSDFSSMCLTKKELDLLKLLAMKSQEVEIYKTSSDENRIIFSVPDITINTLVSVPTRDEMIVAQFGEIENAKFIEVDKNDFKRVLFLSGLGTKNVSRVTMNYNKDGKGIDATVQGREGNSSFLIKGNNYNNLQPKDEEYEVYAVQLLTLLKSFESSKSLEVAFLNNGVAFRDPSENVYAIMNYFRK